ncbi:MAG: reverse transcriptase domain-containing protein [Phycisphaerales bacterium]|nr:reverse transcriptase domain-containing protein [Phycisphaerales bacterium]
MASLIRRGKFFYIQYYLGGKPCRMVWVSDDVASAFDTVSLDRLMQACSEHFPEDVLWLIRRCAGMKSKRGIRQGSPASPLFWNIFADRFIDRAPLPAGCLIRYADDLLMLCSTVGEAEIAYKALMETCRKAGTPLKGGMNNGIFDLDAGQSVTWLGYRLHRRGDDLGVHIADRGWGRLQQNLTGAHYKPASPIRAIETVQGWLNYFGPCYAFEDRRKVLGRLKDEAAKQGFDELPSRRSLDAFWKHAHACGHRNYEQQARRLSQVPVAA